MEFNEKLQKLRTEAGLTQEELAEKLYVSRTAVSKWESGRGYPSIDSLKAVAKYFHVTVDELIDGEEMVTLAEAGISASNKKYAALICGVLDCLTLLLFFLPVFGNGSSAQAESAAMLSLEGVSVWLKITFAVIVGLTVLNGFGTVVISSLDRPLWTHHRVITGIALSIIGTVLFVLTRQPYAGVFCLFILVIKGFLFLKSK